MKIRIATSQDLPEIVQIYNQAIAVKRITADLTPVSVEQRQAWFDAHLNNPKHPIWVLEDEPNPEKTAVEKSGVLGWCSFSPFYPRSAFDQTVEISLYLDQKAQGKGYGTVALQFMQQQMSACGVNTLMAYVIEENQASCRLFEKQGFQQWGRYPHIANMGDSLQTFLMYGFQRF